MREELTILSKPRLSNLSLQMRRLAIMFSSVALFSLLKAAGEAIEVSAPVTSEVAGACANDAVRSVFRLIDTERSTVGTGFLHKSGRIITAAHVIAKSRKDNLKIIMHDASLLGVTDVVIDADCDLALVRPEKPILEPSLNLASEAAVPVGLQVATWGFPVGYSGLRPLLTVGYVAGLDMIDSPRSGKQIAKYVVNAAFNKGNSGGPLLSKEDGRVLGVVSAKLAPVPPHVLSALEALKNQKSGFSYTAKTADGKEIALSEGQIIGEVLTYLRSQTQLVIGHAVSTTDLILFLKREKLALEADVTLCLTRHPNLGKLRQSRRASRFSFTR